MAKIEKLKKGTATIYPVTIPQAVVDPTSGKSAREELDEKANHGYDSAPKTLKAVDEAKVDKTSIVGETGQGETSVMHQKAVTDELGTKAAHGYTNSPKTLKQVDDSVSQLAGDVSLLDAVQGAKIKGIESIISTMNPNQSAQLSVSGRKVVSLPKNASNGGMQVKLEGLTAENLVVNGDFRNGLTGWTTYSSGTAVIENGYIKYTPASTAGAMSNGIKALSAGDKWYIKSVMKSDSAVICTAGFAKSGVGTLLIPTTSIGTSDTTMSGIVLIENTSINELIFGRPSVLQPIYIKSAFAINLTTAFGAGNEPTVEECDAMFGDYFEGVKSFEPTGRVRSDIGGRNLFTTHDKQDKVAVIDGVKVLTSNGYPNSSGNIPSTVLVFSTNLEKNTDYTLSGEFTNTSPDGYNNVVLAYTDWKVNIGKFKKDYEKTVITFRLDPDREFVGLATDNGSYTGYYKYDTIKLEKGTVATPWTPAPEDVLAGTAKGTGTSLYLTAPELRSNGAVKDEIRKGANGYELVKRVGVGTLGNNLVTNGTFDTDTGWTVVGESTISNGSARIYTPDGSQTYIGDTSITLSSTKAYKAIFDVLDSNGEGLHLSSTGIITTPTPIRAGISKLFVGNGGYLSFRRSRVELTDVTIDNVKLHEVLLQDGAISDTSVFTEFSDGTILYTLATPEIIPISYGGVLNSAENGTVYHEPIITDAGVYDTKMDILLTDYPIATIEEIIKHENGIDTYLNVASAVVAGDGLSFTHPDLASGDLVLFTYAFEKESPNGNITATFYDSNVVKIDTVTGKAYRINEVVTNGVLTRTLTEV